MKMNYEDLLEQLVKKDERLIVMTAENRAAIRNLPEKIGDHFIDTGITEQTLVGCAAGLALRGRIPIVHALATFLTMRAFEFIRTDIGISHLPVKLVGFIPGFLSEANGPTHQAIEDISLMRSIPGMRVFAPADREDLMIGLPAILQDPHPWYIRYIDRTSGFSHSNEFRIGYSETLHNNIHDVCILTYGTLFNEAMLAAKILESQGYGVSVVNMRTLEPVDEDVIIKAAIGSQLLVSLEDHLLTGGLYTIIAETFLKNSLTCDVLPLALDKQWFRPLLLNDILEYEGFTPRHIAQKIEDYVSIREYSYAQQYSI
jgi:transketolase